MEYHYYYIKMGYEIYQTALSYVYIILFSLCLSYTIYVFSKLRGIKIKKFQLWTILLYLTIYVISITESAFDLSIGWYATDQAQSGKYANIKFAISIIDSLEVMGQWILIYLQVIFLRGLMLRLKINDFKAFIRKNVTVKRVKYYSIIATIIETGLSIVSLTIMKLNGENIDSDSSLQL